MADTTAQLDNGIELNQPGGNIALQVPGDSARRSRQSSDHAPATTHLSDPQDDSPVSAHPELAYGFPLEGSFLSGPKSNGDHWEQCHMAVEKYDNDMCKSWREEIDTLLVFAGLFTAIVTAFTVESYQWLQPDPADMNNLLILHLSRQMANNSISPASDPSSDFVVPAYAIRINCFWFLSITLSLGAGVIGILCKQWIREFQRDAALPPKDALALRQLRYIGWKRWGVPHIISSPAIILQLSLLLFLAGLADLLWSKAQCPPVAICATVVIGIVATSMGFTTVAPFVYFLYLKRNNSAPVMIPQCPFKSPQAYLLLRLWDVFDRFMFMTFFRYRGQQFTTWLMMERATLNGPLALCGVNTWAQRARVRYLSMALYWVRNTLAFNGRVRNSLYHCFLDSRLACGHHESQFHLYAPDTHEACESDHYPHRILRYLYTDESPVLVVEIMLRDHLLQSQHEEPFYLFKSLASIRPLEIPDTVLKQALRYAQYCVKHGNISHPMWTWLFRLRQSPPEYDAMMIRLLRDYLKRLSDESNSAKRFQWCKDFIYALSLQALGDLVKHTRDSPVFGLLLTCLKKTRYYLHEHDAQRKVIFNAEKFILFFEYTARHHGLVDDPQDDCQELPQSLPQPQLSRLAEEPSVSTQFGGDTEHPTVLTELDI